MIFDRAQKNNVERLKNVLISDKQFSPKRVETVLKSDLFSLLSNYCSLEPQNLNVSVEVLSDGTYKFSIDATSNRMKIFGSLPDEY